MRDDSPGPLGGKDKVLEAAETFIGPPKWIYSNDRGWLKRTPSSNKHALKGASGKRLTDRRTRRQKAA
jgi:hypothetical protein